MREDRRATAVAVVVVFVLNVRPTVLRRSAGAIETRRALAETTRDDKVRVARQYYGRNKNQLDAQNLIWIIGT